MSPSEEPTDQPSPRDHVLLVFAKHPRAGRVKTRLGAEIGMAAAARIYRSVGRSVVDALRGGPYRTVICYAPRGALVPVQRWLGTEGLEFWAQSDGDLGDRMRNAVARAFEQGHLVCVVGTDAPALEARLVCRAFEALRGHDVVFGPAVDGGYYLLALRGPAPELFGAMPWSTDRVLAESELRAASAGRSTLRLEPLGDVDTARDLARHPELLTSLRFSDTQG